MHGIQSIQFVTGLSLFITVEDFQSRPFLYRRSIIKTLSPRVCLILSRYIYRVVTVKGSRDLNYGKKRVHDVIAIKSMCRTSRSRRSLGRERRKRNHKKLSRGWRMVDTDFSRADSDKTIVLPSWTVVSTELKVPPDISRHAESKIRCCLFHLASWSLSTQLQLTRASPPSFLSLSPSLFGNFRTPGESSV